MRTTVPLWECEAKQKTSGIGQMTYARFYKLRNELKLSVNKLIGNSIIRSVLVDILSRLKAVNEKYKIIKE